MRCHLTRAKPLNYDRGLAQRNTQCVLPLTTFEASHSRCNGANALETGMPSIIEFVAGFECGQCLPVRALFGRRGAN